MASESNITIIGNVTREPEMRYTPTGATNAQFSVAVNRRWMDRKSNEWQEKVSFFDVVCWRELAENVAESLTKGARVIVTGRLEQDTWDDKETGAKRSKVQIVADEVGPSLRWASASITKNDRKSGGDFGGPGTGGGGGGQSPPPADDFGGGEEPF